MRVFSKLIKCTTGFIIVETDDINSIIQTFISNDKYIPDSTTLTISLIPKDIVIVQDIEEANYFKDHRFDLIRISDKILLQSHYDYDSKILFYYENKKLNCKITQPTCNSTTITINLK
jgi:hypothetical protein